MRPSKLKVSSEIFLLFSSTSLMENQMYPQPFQKEWLRLARGFSQIQQLVSLSTSGGLVDYVAGCGLVLRYGSCRCRCHVYWVS
jgi:hypothetical protein